MSYLRLCDTPAEPSSSSALHDLPPFSSPYARLNVRRNPFGELTREERAELAVVDAEQWLEVLGRSTTALQFIGACGHGKTTHLLAIRRLLPQAPYVYLPEEGPQPEIPATRPLFVDEAQRLSRRARRNVFRLGGPLILGTHEDLSGPLRRSGLNVTTIQVGTGLCPEHLARILNRRIVASRLSTEAVPQLTRHHAIALQRRFGCNIRSIEQYLYIEFQDAVQKGKPWPPAI